MSVQDNVLGAMDIIASSMVSNLKLDKTVQAVVQEVVNMTTGEYRVEYNGNVVTAFALNTDDTYSVNEKVFLKIPENDMNNKKFIEGRASSSSLSDLQQTELSNSISKEGPSWEQIYPTLDLNNTEQKYCVEAGVDENHQYYSYTIWDRDINSSDNIALSDEIFLTYSQNYDKIYVGADFQTTFVDSDLVGQGNYGLIFTFIARQQSEDVENEFTEDFEVSYRLDINSFTGNPYAYTVFSPQETILDLKSNYLLKLKSIILFQENFTGIDKVDAPNICVRNIKMQFARIEDLSQTLYNLRILTPDGVNLMDDNDEITLIANFLYKGQNILSEKTCKCDWYILDPSVVVGTEFYEKDTGPGWLHLEENSIFGQYIVSGSDVLFSNRYMCKITYNEDLVMTTEIDILKHDSLYNLILEQSMESKEAVLSIVNLNEDGNNYVGDWYYEYGDGTFTDVIDGQDVSKIYINRYLSYATVTFYCQVKLGEEKICVLSKVITSSNVDSELAIEYEGQDIFNYTADGDMPIENCEKDQTLYPKLSWRDGYASTYKIQWEIDGKILNVTDRYSPPYSMMQDMWIDLNGVLHFKVKQKYSRLYINNTLILKIITVDNKEFAFEKEIVFVKMGDQGTNGTTFVSAVRAVDANLDKLSGFQPLIPSGFLRLRNFIYKDGDLINNDPNYSIEYSWSSDGIRTENLDETEITNSLKITNSYKENVSPTFTIAQTGNSDTVTISLQSQTYNRLIIKCEVTVTSNNLYGSEEREKVILHYNYPVPLITNMSGSFNSEDFNVQIPEYIQYDANGQTAMYLDDEIYFKYKNQDYTNSIRVGSDSVSVLSIEDYQDEDGNTKRRLKAAGSYDYANNGNAYLNISVDGMSIVYPIMMYLNTFGNQAINNWDGTNIAIYNAENGEAGYILAPQIGAGTKDSQGRFTGVVMGDDTTQTNDVGKIPGLYGYQDGVNTFGIKSDGRMYLGKSKDTGRIDFDGNTAMIYGGGGGESETGMTIKLTNLVDNVTGKPIQNEKERDEVLAIQIANDNFTVSYGGEMTANRGTIGGWTINEWGLFSPDTQMNNEKGYPSAEDSGRLMLWAKNPYDPAFVQGNEEKTALLVAEQAKIGGWIIKPSGIYSPDTVFGSEADNKDYVPVQDSSNQQEYKQMISQDGVIMLISKEGSNNNQGYANIGGWIVKKELITSQVQITQQDWNNPDPNKGRANTVLNAKDGIINTSYFTVVAPQQNQPDGTPIGQMGFMTGSITGTDTTINLGISTRESQNTSIVLDATKGRNISLRANHQLLFNGAEYIANSQGRFDLCYQMPSSYETKDATSYITIGEEININAKKKSVRIAGRGVALTSNGTDFANGFYVDSSDSQVYMKLKTASIVLDGSGNTGVSLKVNQIPAERQFGIYCRFA